MAKINKEKIILMTRLAVYDKHSAAKDKRINDYFLHDYIYKSNMYTRIAVITGALILVSLNILYRVLNESADIFDLDYTQELKKIGLFILAAALFYTVIGSLKAAREYYKCQKRIKEYTDCMEKLEKAGLKKPVTNGKRPPRGARQREKSEKSGRK